MDNAVLLNNNEESPKNKRDSAICLVLLGIFAVLFLLTNVFFAVVMVSGDSMNDTLLDGDVLIVNRRLDPDYGDVLVFNSNNGKIIKRVIAKGGDSIYCEDGKVYLKKKGESEFTLVEEPYVKTITSNFNEKVVDENSYFVMGDNRAISNDSRFVGFIKKEDVIGVVSEETINKRGTYTKIFGWIFNL